MKLYLLVINPDIVIPSGFHFFMWILEHMLRGKLTIGIKETYEIKTAKTKPNITHGINISVLGNVNLVSLGFVTQV